MFYKQYGNTDMNVSAIGFGGMRFDDTDVSAGNLEKCAEVVKYAYDKGINYFDTAPFYCQELSEDIFGLAFNQMDRSKFYVSTKTNFNTLYGEPTRDNFFKRLETSLKKMNVDYIDFYHLWCVLTPERYEEQCSTLYGFFEEAKAQGLIKNIVFSSHMGSEELAPVINSNKFKGMLIGYNALNYRFRQQGIKEAYDNGMGVVVMNPLGGGSIPQNPDFFKYLTDGTDLTVAQSALRFVASHKEITIALNGFTTKEHIDDACKAVENLELVTTKQIAEKYETLGVSSNSLCTGCEYCKHCPVDIDIPKFMDAYNQKIFQNEDSVLKSRLANHWHADISDSAKCIACGKCEKLCTQHLPIIDRLAEIAKI